MTRPPTSARDPVGAASPPVPAGQPPGAPGSPPPTVEHGRLAARPDELIATARVEGRALQAGFDDPRTRVWVWAEVADWERRVERLVRAVLTPECQELWGRTVLNEGDAIPLDYLPGSEGWWAEYRLTRRLAELDRILERLEAPRDSGPVDRGDRAPDPMDGGVDGSSTQDPRKDAA